MTLGTLTTQPANVVVPQHHYDALELEIKRNRRKMRTAESLGQDTARFVSRIDTLTRRQNGEPKPPRARRQIDWR